MYVKKVENEQELNDAFKVRKEVFVYEQDVPMEEEIDEHEQEATHFVLYDENEPGGAGRFRIVDGYGKIERVCVRKETRKGGSGKKIMLSIEDHARAQGIDTLKLHAQTHAIPFYEKLGYEVISDEFLDAGIPHRTMKKNI
ncbi:putative GNAT family N-acyltransferase [Cytobacillus horneckiae]|uniref:GNAT family N-acetyltransferase n=1 Tax=Cytobacillus horneckiae TaxID=549687 RepID=A0A2N0ZF90_9BACI|nr:GNAT family N-acetyltransferase [Cytobacillus horneckiae]MBN6887506.1 GNAT family N-acetyltransferase [Cytobacillus horneckiae]MEC1155615.1 GNAT family N-acetyltransferase [Cytobacillus horneckiae]MED2936934.1 GNAT family N-acetyltransferase [Cytobacillus horneckiae]PKG28169.1 GNAT family N-acetyltransferase [Cytobacillus horneckiae]